MSLYIIIDTLLVVLITFFSFFTPLLQLHSMNSVFDALQQLK